MISLSQAINRSITNIFKNSSKSLEKQFGFDKPAYERFLLMMKNMVKLIFLIKKSTPEPQLQVYQLVALHQEQLGIKIQKAI